MPKLTIEEVIDSRTGETCGWFWVINTGDRRIEGQTYRTRGRAEIHGHAKLFELASQP